MQHWDSFMVRINVKASVPDLYAAWSTRRGMEYWFLRQSSFFDSEGNLRSEDEPVQEGDSYEWRWHGWPDDTVERGTIISCNGLDTLSFQFGKAGRCRVRIYQEQGETLVELIQDQIPDDDLGRMTWHVGCKTGWTFYLANLKSLYEGGIDLRNKNMELQEMMNS